MSELNTSEARVIDPILTNVARGYTNTEMVCGNIFPTVPVQFRAGKLIVFNGKEGFIIYDTRRAPGADTKRITTTYGTIPYVIEDHRLEAVLPREIQEESANVPIVNLMARRVKAVQDSMMLRLEYLQSTLATTASNYPTDNKETLSGTDQWSHGSSKVIKSVMDARTVIFKKTGKEPNLLTISRDIFLALKTHPEIIEYVKYSSIPDVTTDLLAKLFEVKKVQVSSALYADEKGVFKGGVWGNFAHLCYSEIGTPEKGNPSFGYTYQLDGYPFVEQRYWEENKAQWAQPVNDANMPTIVGIESGYLFSSVIA